ncbi:hypothetical protein N0V82_007527 [Gnomoniopsis sp. IMI 355080]|nr:hypothetical protein N0V82_007527 [Gnomoniopsis sp. IMI 355080]
MVSGSSVGGIVLPIMVSHLIPSVGFGWAMRITAFLILGLLIFGNIAVKSRLPPTPSPFVLREYILPFLEMPFLLLALGSLFVYLGAFLPFNFIIVQAKAAGVPDDLSEYLVPIINAASIFGRILPAHLGDIYGVFNVCIVCTFVSGILSLALWLPAGSTTAPILVFAVLYGFVSGLTLTIFPALVAVISDIRKLGFRVGALYAFSSFGALFGSPIAGAIVTAQDGGYSGLKIFCGIALIAVSIHTYQINLVSCILSPVENADEFKGGILILLARVKLVGPGLLVKK